MTQHETKDYIGLDVAKAKLDFYNDTLGMHSFGNDSDSIVKLVKLCQSVQNPIVICEATSHYHIHAVQALQQGGIQVSVMNPRYVRSYAKAMGHLEKTDAIDAKVITRFGMSLQPCPTPLLTEQFLELQGLQTRQRQLTNMLALEKTHIEGLIHPAMKKQAQQHIDHLAICIKTVEEQMDAIIEQNPTLIQKMQILTSMTGIGNKTARLLIAQLPELGQLGIKAIAKLVGLAPLNNDSGTMKGKRTIHGGRAIVRNGLYMATLSAIKHDPKLGSFYQHLVQRGKKKKVAIVACMRKVLIILNTMVKNNETYVKPI